MRRNVSDNKSVRIDDYCEKRGLIIGKRNVGLNRNQLKYIAVIAMIIDHVGLFLIPDYNPLRILCRFIGRLTAPIMCYFLAEGFYFTSSKKKYVIRLLVFALISQIAYGLLFYHRIFVFDFNMIYTLLISFIILMVYSDMKYSMRKKELIFILLIYSAFGDWGIIAPLWVLSFYIYRDDISKKITAFSIISFCMIMISVISCILNQKYWYAELWQLGVLLFVPILLMYNGKKGKSNFFNKWFFYIVYPLHMFIFLIITSI